MIPMTEKQRVFLRDLVEDLKRLFLAREGDEAGEMDFVAWMCGLLHKHDAKRHGEAHFDSLNDLREYLYRIDVYQARKLIEALGQARARIDAKLPREAVVTPPPILSAIWTAAKRQGMGRDTVHEICFAVCQSDSTKHLRREEALEVLKRVGGSTRIFEMTPPRSRDGRPGLKETNRTIV